MTDDFSDWVSFSSDPIAADEGMSALDPVKKVGADILGEAAAVASAGQFSAEQSNYPNVARMMRGVSMGLHRGEEAVSESITPAGRMAAEAALLPDKDQEQLGSHPFREVFMKGAGLAVPFAVGSIGFLAGGGIGTAGGGAMSQVAHGIDQAIAHTNDLTDEDLARESPRFAQYFTNYIGQGMDEAEAASLARRDLHADQYTFKQAFLDATTGAAAYSTGAASIKGQIGGEGLVRHVLTGGLETGAAIGASSAASEIGRQEAEIAEKGGQRDPVSVARALANGGFEGFMLHAAGTPFNYKGERSEDTTRATTPQGEVDVPPADTSAAPSTGATPKGARATTQPPPNEAAQDGQIGNTVNPPTRDQGVGPAGQAIKAKRGRKAKAEVPVVDVKAPAPAEVEALNASTPGAPDATTLVEPKPPVDLASVQVPPPREPGLEPLQRQEIPDAPVTPEVRATENELLGLGPFNKEQVAADIAAGGETAAAATTDRLAPDTVQLAEPSQVDTPAPIRGDELKEKVARLKYEASRAWVLDDELHQLLDFISKDFLNWGNVSGDGRNDAHDVIKKLVSIGRRDAAEVYLARLEQSAERNPSNMKKREAADGARSILDHAVKKYSKTNSASSVAAGGQELAAVARDEMRAIRERLSNRAETQEAPADPNAFDEALARREAEEQLRSAQPKVDREGRRVLPPPPTEENIRALVEQRRAEWKVEQEKAAAEERRAKRDLEEAEAEEKENAPPAPPEDFKSKKNPKRDRERTEKRAKADELFEAHKDGMSTSGRGAILKRIQTILAEAKDRGVSVVSKLDYDKHSAGQAFLKEAQILVSRARASKTKLPTAEDISRFVQAEYDLRDGLEGFDRYKKNARAEGDAKNTVKFNEAYKKGGKQAAEDKTGEVSGELEHGTGDEVTDDDRENEGQARTLADVVVDREDEVRSGSSDYEEDIGATEHLAPRGSVLSDKEARADDVAKRNAERLRERSQTQDETQNGDAGIVGKDKAGTFQRVEPKRRVINRPGVGPKVQEVKARTTEPAATERWEYADDRGFPPNVREAKRAVVDYMNGDISKDNLIERLSKLDLQEGVLRTTTNRIADFKEPDVKRVLAAEPDVRPMVSMRSREEAAADKLGGPKSRPISLEDELLAGMDPVEDRTTGEREGHVSYDYGRDTPSTKILRTRKVNAIFREVKGPETTLAGKLFPLIRMRLQQIAGDVDVHFVDPRELSDMATASDPKAKNVSGFYKARSGAEGGYIVLADNIPKERLGHVFTHEVLHAATEDALQRNAQFRDQIDAIRAEVEAAFPDRVEEYGFTNASEFVAEAFSNPKFQEMLASTRVSDKLARQLGLERRSLWSALVDKIRGVLGMPAGTYSALEALVRPTNDAMTFQGRLKDYERMDREAAASRPYIGEELVQRARELAEDKGVNSRNVGRKLLRGSASNTMLARMSAKLGPKFGYWARQANALHEKMAVRTGNLLDRKGGGLEIVREGDELRRLDPTRMSETMDIGWEITELNLDMSDGAKNEHIFGKSADSDILAATQAKAAYEDLRKRLDALPNEYREWLEKSAKFFRDEDNAKRLAVIERVLKEAEIKEPGLAQRILDGKMTAADEAKFKTDTIVKHLNEIAELKRLQGWYFPLERDGDFVLTAERQFATPAGKNIERLKDANGNQTNELLVSDPDGKQRFAPARRAAQKLMSDLWATDRMHAKAEPVYVLKSDGKTIVPKAEAEAVGGPDTFRAYKVSVQAEYMSMHKDEASRNRRAQEIQSAGYRNISQSVRRDNPNAKWGGLVPSQMETVIKSLENRDRFKNLSEGGRNELVQTLRQATIKLLPGSRIQHHNLQRRNIDGYSRDMINSIARNAQQSAAFQARTELQPEINRALQSMQDEINKDRYSFRTQERQELKNALETRLAIGTDIKPPNTLEKGLNFVNKLSMLDKLVGPSFHIINAQEPWTTAAPVIGGRHGFVNSARMLKGAYNMIGARGALGAGFRDTKLAWGQDSGFTDYRRMFQGEIAKNISGDRGRRLNEVLDHLHDLNLFGHEAGMEVSRLAQPAETMIGRAVDRVDLMSRQVGQAIEAINRAVTGIAAYELEFKRNGGNHQAAMRYAHDTVHDTMGNYSASNAAPVFNSPLGKSALQFKKFAQRTYFLLGKMVGEAAKGDREALRSFAGVMFTHGVVAGALGLPLEPIKVALMASGSLGGYSYDDFEGLVRDTAAQALGKTGGEAVTRGLPRALLGIDTSGRQGLDSLLTFGKPLSGKTNDLKAWLFDTVGGAPLGMPLKAIAAAQAAVDGDIEKTIDNAIPVKAIRDLGRAGFGLAGGKLDRTGRQMMEPYSPYEAAVQALGFTPGRKAEDYEERARVNNESFQRKEERTGLINDWVNATPAGKAKAWRAVQEFNRTVPRDAQITMKQLQSQAKSRAKEKAEGKYDRGMRIGKQNRDIYERAQRTY